MLNKLTFIILTIFSVQLQAATYYIDFAKGSDTNAGTQLSPWKHHPYMQGWTGKYTHITPDVFIFKGGSTWDKTCWPLIVLSSGDQYLSDGTGLPIWDAGGAEPAGGMVQGESRSDLVFDSIWFTNYGSPNKAEGKKAIYFNNSNRLTFNSCKFTTYSWITIFLPFDKAGSYSTWNITNNECSNTTALLWIADSYQTGLNRSGLMLTGNWIHDFSSQIGGGVHSDGLIHSFGSSALTGSKITNNKVTGDFRRSFGTDGAMTAFIFCEDNFSGEISGNLIQPTPVQPSMLDGYLVIHAASGQSVSIHDNTLINGGASSASAGMHLFCPVGGTMNVQKNIVTGLDYAVYVEQTGGSYTSDYNTFDSSRGYLAYGSAFQTYAQWQAAGRDVHGTLGPYTPPTPPVNPIPVPIPPTNATVIFKTATISPDGKTLTITLQ